ncbi:CAZyme family AA9 [Agaricus bisporus var. burnettii]|uniref:AA9 family lytic polysaccharide monooxygenase n=1 Tax=Agaricus bisporus var. burnettii TaxID=192524 RepID=A0A8H7BZW1_AGABI|nr:CAZyme family AA9 [Agaricus bisporus var. burnettii]
MKLATLAVPVLTAAYASAHGYLHSISIDGQSYSGNRPHKANDASAIRQVADQGPVKGTKNKDMNCGLGSPKPAALDAEANPGDTISFEWTAIDGGNWIHQVGPMMTYMASCGDQDCNKFDSTTAKWFKIDEQGQASSGTWAQKQIFDQKPFKVSLPKNIAPGNYLIRQEVIALHAAVSVGGAEFYPSCSQLKIGGSGTGKPKSSELVSFPGAYDDEDAGIVVPDIFNPGFKYQFPGPKIASFVNGGGDSGNSGDDEEDDSDSNSDSGSHDHPSSTVTSKKPAPTKSQEDTSPDHGTPSKSSSKIPSPTQNNTTVKPTSRCKQKRGLRSSGMLPMADDLKMDSSMNVKRHQRHINRVKRSSSFGLKH